jgi:hypothetical protein
MNNTWHHFDEGAEIVAVFVHGYFSSAESCWRNNKNSVFWPDLLLRDERLPPMSIFLGGYYTGVNSGSYGIGECADELFGALQRDSSGGQPAPLKAKNIVFVCHSLGGIVTRYMLQAYQIHFARHKIGLLLMASPSIGSDYAAGVAGGVISFYKNNQGKQLAPYNRDLVGLDDRFKRYQQSRSDADLVGAEAVEHLGMFSLKWLPGFRPIVLKESAARYFSNNRTLPGCDHSSIVKPTDLDHASHTFLVDFFVNNFLGIAELSGATNISLEQEALPPRSYSRGALFDIYNQDCDQFYLVRSVDEQISTDFSLSSIWVYGVSGTGKTSAVNRLISRLGCRSISMCFSQCDVSNARSSFIAEMIESLHLHSENGSLGLEKSYTSLVKALLAKINEFGSLVVFIDEVPAGDNGAGAELLVLIEDILTSIKQVNASGAFSVIVSSLDKPCFSSVKNQAKLNQYLSLREFTVWGARELEDLISLILPFLPEAAREGLDAQELINRAEGSPRFLKTFLKNKIARPEKSAIELFMVSAGGV